MIFTPRTVENLAPLIQGFNKDSTRVYTPEIDNINWVPKRIDKIYSETNIYVDDLDVLDRDDSEIQDSSPESDSESYQEALIPVPVAVPSHFKDLFPFFIDVAYNDSFLSVKKKILKFIPVQYVSSVKYYCLFENEVQKSFLNVNSIIYSDLKRPKLFIIVITIDLYSDPLPEKRFSPGSIKLIR